MAKDLPAEVSDKELAAMDAAGELPKARARPYGSEIFRGQGLGSRATVGASPTGGETPAEAAESWRARETAPYSDPSHADNPKNWEAFSDASLRNMDMWKAAGVDPMARYTANGQAPAAYVWAAKHGAQFSPEIHAAIVADEAFNAKHVAHEGEVEERYSAKGSREDLEELFTTGADDPTRPTRTELPDERAKAIRESAAKKALEK